MRESLPGRLISHRWWLRGVDHAASGRVAEGTVPTGPTCDSTGCCARSGDDGLPHTGLCRPASTARAVVLAPRRRSRLVQQWLTLMESLALVDRSPRSSCCDPTSRICVLSDPRRWCRRPTVSRSPALMRAAACDWPTPTTPPRRTDPPPVRFVTFDPAQSMGFDVTSIDSAAAVRPPLGTV